MPKRRRPRPILTICDLLKQNNEICDGDLFLPEGAQSQVSGLFHELGGAEFFTYQNENKVQHLVASCLKDALRTLGLYDDYSIEKEHSLFSLRPDFVVVSHTNKGVILVVEVKKPNVGVFESKEVAGQIYDHLVGELLSGISSPFAVLSSL